MIRMKTVSLVHRLSLVASIVVVSTVRASNGPDTDVTTRPAPDVESPRVLHFRAALTTAGGAAPFYLDILQGADGASTPESGRRVLIQCDRDREFALLKKILRTCSEAGYEAPGLLIERSGS